MPTLKGTLQQVFWISIIISCVSKLKKFCLQINNAAEFGLIIHDEEEFRARGGFVSIIINKLSIIAIKSFE